MRTLERWWDTPLTNALASLAIALTVTFLPFAIDQVRARRRAKPIQIVATATDTTVPFAYAASSEVTPPPAESVAVSVVITNVRPDSVWATVTQDCPVFFELRDVGDTAGPPRWDGRWGTCHARGRKVALGPEQRQLLRATVAVADVLGDSLPDGSYLVTAIFELDGKQIADRAGELTLRRRGR